MSTETPPPEDTPPQPPPTPEANETPQQGLTPKTWGIIAGAGALAVLAVIGISIALVSGNDDTPIAEPTSSSAPVTAPPAPAKSKRELAVEDALVRVEKYLAVEGSLYADPDPNDGWEAKINGLSTVNSRAQIRGYLKKIVSLGQSSEGEATVELLEATKVKLNADPPVITLRTCMDISEVNHYKNDKPYKNPDGYYGPRLVDFKLIEESGVWKVDWVDAGKDLQPCPN